MIWIDLRRINYRAFTPDEDTVPTGPSEGSETIADSPRLSLSSIKYRANTVVEDEE